MGKGQEHTWSPFAIGQTAVLFQRSLMAISAGLVSSANGIDICPCCCNSAAERRWGGPGRSVSWALAKPCEVHELTTRLKALDNSSVPYHFKHVEYESYLADWVQNFHDYQYDQPVHHSFIIKVIDQIQEWVKTHPARHIGHSDASFSL